MSPIQMEKLDKIQLKKKVYKKNQAAAPNYGKQP